MQWHAPRTTKVRHSTKQSDQHGDYSMQTNEIAPGRVRRTVDDLILAEMFLVQATLESASAISDGLDELSRQVANNSEDQRSLWGSIRTVLQRTAGDALEPYTSRFKYLREIAGSDR
jgi:hypothetical protein